MSGVHTKCAGSKLPHLSSGVRSQSGESIHINTLAENSAHVDSHVNIRSRMFFSQLDQNFEICVSNQFRLCRLFTQLEMFKVGLVFVTQRWPSLLRLTKAGLTPGELGRASLVTLTPCPTCHVVTPSDTSWAGPLKIAPISTIS